jgi:hypothetical protein
MKDGIMLMIGEDGKATVYDDTYDVVIHCGSQEEQDRVIRLLKNVLLEHCGSGELVQESDSLVKDLVKDCISREAVLDAIDKYILGKPEGCTVEVKELLKLITKIYHMPIYRMPSAQYSDAYKAGFNKGYEKAKKEMERQVFVTSDGKVHTITTTWLGDFSPYTCKHCGFHVDSMTKYCPECGRKAVP